MFTARALRCAHATSFARRAALHPPYLQASIRLNSSSAIDTANKQSTQDEKQTDAPQQEEVERRVPETPGLDASLGVENMNKARRLHFEVKRLARELDQIYGRQRIIRKVSPYRVRIGATPFAFNKRAESETHPEVRDGKMFLVDRLIPSIWLRDNCQCKVCTHDATKQRLLDTFSIPEDISIKSYSAETRGSETVHRIEWSDGHESEYSGPFLSQATNNARLKAVQRQALVNIKPWDSSIASDPPKTLYANAMNPNTNDLLFRLRRFGFCYVDETPFENPEATKKMLEKIAFIRETHYGGFYDFTADLASKDTAYTNIALEAHTDTTYFSDPAGLQAFHLLSHTDGEGGASLLVDGFKAADELWHTDRKAYEILSTVNVHGHASGNEGISIQPYRGFPVLEHDTATGDLLRVRWNTSDRASIELPIEEVETWYDAARKFDAILKKKENEYWEQLVPGRVLIFDNWRVLHGRSSFTGKRRICGAYINRDDWISKFKMRHFGKENVLKGLAVN